MEFKVIYEDNHLIAVNKPSGVLSQGDNTGDLPIAEYVKTYIKKKYKKPGDVFLGVIHRLDRPVSGVTIFARTSKALSRMNEIFRKREIQKTYLAISHRMTPDGEAIITHYLSKDQKRNTATAYDKPKGSAKESSLEYRMLSRVDNAYLYEIKPQHGRPHQIRVQMSKIGCPLIGDLRYGSTKKTTNQSIGLHCFALEFIHPVKKTKIIIKTKPPKMPLWTQFDLRGLNI